MKAVSRLVGADQVYTAPADLTVYVVDVVRGYVVADIYRSHGNGSIYGDRVRLPRAVFQLLFTNYSFDGGGDAIPQDAGAVGVERPGPAAVRGVDGRPAVRAVDGVSS